MELMKIFDSLAFWRWIVQSLVLFFLIGGFALLAIGVSLIVHSAGTLRFFAAMNRWVSMRRFSKPLDVPRDTRQAVQKNRRWLAAIFIAGGVFALYGLATQFNARAIIFVFGLDTLRPVLASWLVESARWVLIVGNLAAIAVGILLGFFPKALIALEARGGRWYSDRQLARSANAMHLSLDNWVEAYPRASGWIITFFALVLIAAYGLMLPGVQ